MLSLSIFKEQWKDNHDSLKKIILGRRSIIHSTRYEIEMLNDEEFVKFYLFEYPIGIVSLEDIVKVSE